MQNKNKQLNIKAGELAGFFCSPNRNEKRDEYEKLTSGRVFKSRYFMVGLLTNKYKLDL